MEIKLTEEEMQTLVPEITKHYNKCMVCGESKLWYHGSSIMDDQEFPLPLVLVECDNCGFIAAFNKIRVWSTKVLREKMASK